MKDKEFIDKLKRAISERNLTRLVYEGKPKRTNILSKDEILNLRITLNTTKSVKEFLNRI